MKITSLETRLLAIDPRPRYRDGKIPPGRPSVWHYPLVIIHTDAGVDGYSMAYGPHSDGQTCAGLLHDSYYPQIADADPTQIEAIWQKLFSRQRHLYNQTDTLVGVIDVALWDILGKVTGKPIATLLGQYSASRPAYLSARSEKATADEIAAEVCAAKAAGYRGYKLQLRDGPEADIPRLRAAREAIGPDFPLMQDPNSAYSLPEALAVGYALDELGYHWFEEPLPEQQVENYRHLISKIRTPVLAGETIKLTALSQFFANRSMTMARGDVLIKAGITGLRKAFAACELAGINLEVHTANTPLLDVANLHVACAARNITWMEVHHPIFRFALQKHPFDVGSDGLVHLPTGPGLGVELDWEWIEKHTVDIRRS